MLALITPVSHSRVQGFFIGIDPDSFGLQYPNKRSGNTPRHLSDLRRAPELAHDENREILLFK